MRGRGGGLPKLPTEIRLRMQMSPSFHRRRHFDLINFASLFDGLRFNNPGCCLSGGCGVAASPPPDLFTSLRPPDTTHVSDS